MGLFYPSYPYDRMLEEEQTTAKNYWHVYVNPVPLAETTNRKRYVLTYSTYFSSAHRIPGHPKCGRVHGHNFRVKVWILENFEAKGMFDFGEVKKFIEGILESYDHYNITEKYGITTAEELAKEIFDRIQAGLKKLRDDLTLMKVKVCETDKYCVEVQEEVIYLA